MPKFSSEDFHRLDPVPEEGIKRAVALMQTGEIFRYLGAKPEDCEVALLERDFAAYIGTGYALAVNSCSSAIKLALLACGVKPGDQVLVPAFTFTSVPSAVVNVGAVPILVECRNWRVDLDDFVKKAENSTAKVFLLSYMRGHLPDLDKIIKFCRVAGIALIEDAAHALGNKWNGQLAGSFGDISVFSFQSNKVINSGEGGMLCTNNRRIIAQSIYRSGAYEGFCQKHFLDNDGRAALDTYHNLLPLENLRMTNIVAAIVRSQLPGLEEKGKAFRKNYEYLAAQVSNNLSIELPESDEREELIPDSLQFRLCDTDFNSNDVEILADMVKKPWCGEPGLPLAAFAGADNARSFWNWGFLGNIPYLPITTKELSTACDMRLCASFTEAHLYYIADRIINAAELVRQGRSEAQTSRRA
jgi:dTDP-4-amino-4,6-dideoxygalactose transaminase